MLRHRLMRRCRHDFAMTLHAKAAVSLTAPLIARPVRMAQSFPFLSTSATLTGSIEMGFACRQ